MSGWTGGGEEDCWDVVILGEAFCAGQKSAARTNIEAFCVGSWHHVGNDSHVDPVPSLVVNVFNVPLYIVNLTFLSLGIAFGNLKTVVAGAVTQVAQACALRRL